MKEQCTEVVKKVLDQYDVLIQVRAEIIDDARFKECKSNVRPINERRCMASNFMNCVALKGANRVGRQMKRMAIDHQD